MGSTSRVNTFPNRDSTFFLSSSLAALFLARSPWVATKITKAGLWDLPWGIEELSILWRRPSVGLMVTWTELRWKSRLKQSIKGESQYLSRMKNVKRMEKVKVNTWREWKRWKWTLEENEKSQDWPSTVSERLHRRDPRLEEGKPESHLRKIFEIFHLQENWTLSCNQVHWERFLRLLFSKKLNIDLHQVTCLFQLDFRRIGKAVEHKVDAVRVADEVVVETWWWWWCWWWWCWWWWWWGYREDRSSTPGQRTPRARRQPPLEGVFINIFFVPSFFGGDLSTSYFFLGALGGNLAGLFVARRSLWSSCH